MCHTQYSIEINQYYDNNKVFYYLLQVDYDKLSNIQSQNQCKLDRPTILLKEKKFHLLTFFLLFLFYYKLPIQLTFFFFFFFFKFFFNAITFNIKFFINNSFKKNLWMNITIFTLSCCQNLLCHLFWHLIFNWTIIRLTPYGLIFRFFIHFFLNLLKI